jgi:predicted Zn-dependent peptidase
MTAYWLHLLPENLSKGVSVLSDMLRPALRAADFDAEKEVILEEIAMYNDQPFWVVYEKAMAHLYPEHPLGHRVLGTKETVGQLDREVMLAYFDKRYASDNITFAAAGAVDFDLLLDQLNDACGSWSPSSATRDLARPKSQSEREDLAIKELAQTYLLMLGPAPDANSDQRHTAGLLSHVFGGSDSSRLYWKLVETGIAEEAQSSFDPRQNAGEFATWAVIQPDRAEEVEQMIRAEIAHLPNTIEQSELDRARARIATAAVLASERPLGRVNRLASNWLTRAAYIPIETDMQAIDAITVGDLCDCADLWSLEPTVTMIAHG